jgi:hypothetical protein
MKTQALLILLGLTVFTGPALARKKKHLASVEQDHPVRYWSEEVADSDVYRAGIPLDPRYTESILLTNKGSVPSKVVIEKYLASGELVDIYTLEVPPQAEREVRIPAFRLLEGRTQIGQYAWMRVTAHGSVEIRWNTEILEGNILETLEQPKGAMSAKSHTRGYRGSNGGRITFYLNLTDHPVTVGFCQSSYATGDDLPCPIYGAIRTVDPKGMAVFPMDGRQFTRVVTAEAYDSIGTIVYEGSGPRKTFESDSAIQFDPVK